MAVNPDPQDLVTETLKGVGVIPSWKLEDAMYGEDPAQVPEFEQMAQDTRAWCEQYAVSFYAAPREDFSVRTGVKAALAAGHRYVVVEDLS